MKKKIITIIKSNKITRKLLKMFINFRRKLWYKNACKKFAVDEHMILFESFMGRSFADSPKALFLKLKSDERFKDYTFVWSFRIPNEKKDIEELKNVVIVKQNSKQYYEYYSKTKYMISNSRIDIIIKKRPGQVYIQTWHGTPLKRLGFDIKIGNNAKYSTQELCQFYKLDCERYDYLLSPSEFCTEKFTTAFQLKENAPQVEIVQGGYPRNDFLSNYTDKDVHNIKRKLGIENINKKIILYAPTWRDNQHTKNVGYTYNLEVDFDDLRDRLGDDYIVLFRAHYFVANAFDFDKYSGFVYNVSHYDDINDLYVISDLLITDYSSVFFDYAILKRPMIFYMYDLDFYKEETRGFYISLDELPGNIVTKQEDLINEIRKEFIYDDRYKKFNEKFNSLEDGHASLRVIEKCFK